MAKVFKRLKNKKVLLAVISGILMILLNIGVIDVALSEQIIGLANTVLSIGVAIGILSNPDKVKPKKKTK